MSPAVLEATGGRAAAEPPVGCRPAAGGSVLTLIRRGRFKPPRTWGTIRAGRLGRRGLGNGSVLLYARRRSRGRRDSLRERRKHIDGCRAPRGLIQLVDKLHMDKRPSTVPDFDTVVDTETRREGCGEQEATVWRPFAVRSIRGINSCHLSQGAAVVDIDLASEITETSDSDEPCLGVERDEVAESSAKVVQ